jgi:hypothetical protein
MQESGEARRMATGEVGKGRKISRIMVKSYVKNVVRWPRNLDLTG